MPKSLFSVPWLVASTSTITSENSLWGFDQMVSDSLCSSTRYCPAEVYSKLRRASEAISQPPPGSEKSSEKRMSPLCRAGSGVLKGTSEKVGVEGGDRGVGEDRKGSWTGACCRY